MSSPWSRSVSRRTLCLLAAGSLAVTVAACGDGNSSAQPGGKVKITVTGQPPASQPTLRDKARAVLNSAKESALNGRGNGNTTNENH